METPVIAAPRFPLIRFLFAALLLAQVTALCAQQPLSLADAAVRGQAIFDQSALTGMVLVVVRGREVLITSYGETAPGSGRRPAPNSLIRLCSISKILTTDLLLKLANDGKLSLTDPLQRYAPRGKHVPAPPGAHPMTLLNLATHTAGLPREISSYPPRTPHFTFPSYTQRWQWLPGQKLNSAPGTAAAYSNVGFDLLGDALASASGHSYAHLLHERLLRPLDMWDTTLVPSSEQCTRLLQAIDDEGPCTDAQASGASGGVYSTATDMVKLLRYLLHTPGSPAQATQALAVYIKPSQLKSMQGLSHAGDPTGIGLGWIQLGDPASPSMLMEKTGGGAGFTTYIALSPSRQAGVFLASTWGRGEAKVGIFLEANNLLADLAGVPRLPPKKHKAPAPKKPSRLRPRTSVPKHR